MKVIIRKIIASDKVELIDLFNSCFDKNILYHDLDLTDNSHIIVAEIDNKVVGILEINYIYNIIQNYKYAIFNNVCVMKEYRNMGIGKLLLKSAEDICKKEKCKFINLTSNSTRIEAQALYKKEGYKIINTTLFKKDL